MSLVQLESVRNCSRSDGSGRGIPCGCPVATGLRAGHLGQAGTRPAPTATPECKDYVITVDKPMLSILTPELTAQSIYVKVPQVLLL